MSRSIPVLLPMILLVLNRTSAVQSFAVESPASGGPPLTYELMINGESFFIEANRQVKLESREKPGLTYEVALRIALRQSLRLNSFGLQYDWPAQVEDDHGRSRRTVRIAHQLGYRILITDLGEPLDGDAQQKTLTILRESTVQGFRQAGMKQITVAPLPKRQFAAAVARGLAIRFQDDKGHRQACLVYLMTGPNFAGYCIVQYAEADQANVLPRVFETLDSIRASR